MWWKNRNCAPLVYTYKWNGVKLEILKKSITMPRIETDWSGLDCLVPEKNNVIGLIQNGMEYAKPNSQALKQVE